LIDNKFHIHVENEYVALYTQGLLQ
jgi:hypothetical protein